MPRKKLPVPPPSTGLTRPEDLLLKLESASLTLRQRKVARLAAKGLAADAIARELATTTGDKSWTIDLVLNLQGEGAGGFEDLKILRQKYQMVAENIRERDLVEPDDEIMEMRASCLSVLREFVFSRTPDCQTCGGSKPTKEAADLAMKLLRAAGVGVTDVERKVVEHRFDPEAIDALRSLAMTGKPGSAIAARIKQEFSEEPDA